MEIQLALEKQYYLRLISTLYTTMRLAEIHDTLYLYFEIARLANIYN
jgi:hypothetical protein